MNRPTRLEAYLLAGVVLGGLPTISYAQSADVEGASRRQERDSLSATDLDILRREIRDDIKDELRRELKEELRRELLEEVEDVRGRSLEAPGEEDGWAEEGWKWVEPAQSDLNLVELDGYFRFRYDFFFDGLDLGTYYNRGESALPQSGLEQGPFVPGLTSPPTALCNTDVRQRNDTTNVDDQSANSCANRQGNSDTLGGGNIRLRLEPTINVFEDIKIKSQIDILDNLVLGSTPDSQFSGLSPLAAVTQTQIAPTAGLNTIWRDSIRVKRVWAEVMTPLGQLSFGRMPNHVGMGISANAGNGIDRDFGDTVDRIMFAVQLGSFMVAPAYDFAASGASSENRFLPLGQPFDRDEQDDLHQYVLTIAKMDSPEVRTRKLANNEVVFDFGTQVMYRVQDLDSVNSVGVGTVDQQTGDVTDEATTTNIVDRGAQIVSGSLWFELQWRKFALSGEYSGVFGSIDNVVPAGNGYGGAVTPASGNPFNPGDIMLNQHGGALRASYKFLDNDALTLELLVVAASGDGAPGWGLFPMYTGGSGQGFNAGDPGVWDGAQARALLTGSGDNDITNFVFDPDFVVDLIFWRQLVGAVTDALVIRPSVQYDISELLGGRLDVVYSRAWFPESTPSGSLEVEAETPFGSPNANLGLEFDATLYYKSKEGFNGMLQYGLFVPMDGLDRQVFVEEFDEGGRPVAGRSGQNSRVRLLNADLTHTIQVLLGISF
ncbi:MAG: TIGR04551 family protein [Myxococcales bacterium]|nr:TIGR04551 family protein [Myxococcales bacterium]